MKKIRLRKEIKDYFRERSGAIFFLLVVAVMSILVAIILIQRMKKALI